MSRDEEGELNETPGWFTPGLLYAIANSDHYIRCLIKEAASGEKQGYLVNIPQSRRYLLWLAGFEMDDDHVKWSHKTPPPSDLGIVWERSNSALAKTLKDISVTQKSIVEHLTRISETDGQNS